MTPEQPTSEQATADNLTAESPASESPAAENPIDPRAFRSALGCFATGIAVITTIAPDGLPIGVTVNSFSSVSLDPPLVQFCIGRAAMSFAAFTTARHFAVNILAADQQDMSSRFSRRDLQERWSGLDIITGRGGVRLLPGCLATLECDREHLYDGGDHLIVVGRVRNLTAREDGEPLLYFRGAYAHLT
ncbi:flavin reductase family protein [Azospirillum picis]|uniref:Flavin reductase (DIM6/NTAB) family NADH-FMN oxidoreductase RutF n=1 Tax=Azospirillum picis TaxID=488438 RepID=A0ABU0MRQ0_9PROT|nr:flavin reductase family protein [Azospirillum picis]MBP2302600.1 flavin reductase (DIM6/NTAB) family NADH-FMN oxidoreductase RutF [Azospirillum picis]MDQ0536158.1 flavin reductase (DIM6/NTAB) family NADH-FMN oxidoreductase RutF [Azospirillum picis]